MGLVDRAEAAGFVRRCPDPDDARVARVELTEVGDRLVTGLTEATLAEMNKLAAALSALVPAEQRPTRPGGGVLALRHDRSAGARRMAGYWQTRTQGMSAG